MTRAMLYSLVVWISLSSALFGAGTLVPGTVTKVSDGDTVWVVPDEETRVAPEKLKIRSIGIDTPETHLPSPNGVVGQVPWGDSAAEYVAKLIPIGTHVDVEDHGLDKYQRTLGRIFLGSTDLNLEIVKSGWAVTYIICEGKECTPSFFKDENVEGYIDACEHAQKQGLGIWNKKKPLKEMPFEFRMRMTNRKMEKYVGNYETKELFAPEDYKKVPVCKRIFFMTKSAATKVGYSIVE